MNKLIRPFDYIAGEKALIAGIIFSLISSSIAVYVNIHFNGLINIKYIEADAPIYLSFLEPFLNTLVFSAVLATTGLIFKKQFRMIDLIGTQLLSRAPLMLAVLVMLISGITKESTTELMEQLNPQSPDLSLLVPFIVMAIATLPVLVYTLYLMYQSYSVSINLNGVRGVMSFIICFIITEVILGFTYFSLYSLY
jgi:hypothetical protein